MITPPDGDGVGVPGAPLSGRAECGPRPDDWELALGLLANSWRAAFVPVLAGLSPAQYRALLYVARHCPVTIGQMAAGLRISCPAATKLVHRLEERRWVCRRLRSANRREVAITLTAAGERQLQQAAAARRQVIVGTFGQLPAPQQRSLWRAMEQLLDVALTAVPDWQGVCLACGNEARPQACPLVRAGVRRQGGKGGPGDPCQWCR